MAYSLAQMQSILRQAGWPENLLVTMAAIGLKESSGNPRAHNSVPPDDSYGLWQINMIGSLGPQRRAQWGLSSNEDLYDPLTNARAALSVYRGDVGPGGLRNWGPYVTGIYRQVLPASQAAYNGAGAGSVIGNPVINAPLPPIVASSSSSSGDAYQDSGYTLPNAIDTKTLLIIGVGLLGLYLLTR